MLLKSVKKGEYYSPILQQKKNTLILKKYANTLNNLDEINTFLERHKLRI